MAGAVSADELRAAFEAPSPPTIGLEEEVMLLDPSSLDLTPAAPELLSRLDGDARFKLELPAAQLEIAVPPAERVGGAIDALGAARRRLAQAAGDSIALAAAGAHPFAATEATLNRGGRYDALAAGYGGLLRRQLVWALQVHVAVGGAERALAVYNALRSHLPELAALAANAPFYEGRDSGLASVRPLVCQLLPRQGLPPAIESWEAFARELSWGAVAGAVPEPRRWWWELRLNPAFGTLEVRVPDAQSTVADAGQVAAVVHSLVVSLAQRHDEGELPDPVPTWRIAENRWSALRRGLDADLVDLRTGRSQPARERLHGLLDELTPAALRLGCAAELDAARGRVSGPGAPERQRAVAARHGLSGLARWLVDRFLAGIEGHERSRGVPAP